MLFVLFFACMHFEPPGLLEIVRYVLDHSLLRLFGLQRIWRMWRMYGIKSRKVSSVGINEALYLFRYTA